MSGASFGKYKEIGNSLKCFRLKNINPLLNENMFDSYNRADFM